MTDQNTTPAGDDQREALAQVILGVAQRAHGRITSESVDAARSASSAWFAARPSEKHPGDDDAPTPASDDRLCYSDECGEPCQSWQANMRAQLDTTRHQAGTIAQRLGKARAELAARPSAPTVTTEQVGAAVIASGLDHHIGASDTIAFLAALGIEVAS